MTVSKRLRFEILRRDNHACRYCGGSAPDVVLQVDHVTPVALGGSDDPANLVAACKDCNTGKSSIPADAQVVADVSDLAVKMAAAMKQVAEMRAAELDSAFELVDWFTAEWEAWTNWRGDAYDADDVPASIPQFVKAGLTRQEMKELIAVAMRGPAKDKWKYFCGCCWKRIRQNQELAAEIVREVPTPSSSAVMSTKWTAGEIDGLLERSESTAARWLDAESSDSLACNHIEDGNGHCGDPLCRLQRAEGLGWMSYSKMLDWDRECAVMDEAEALIDG